MQDETARFTECFQPLFDAGLINIKIFVSEPEKCSLESLLAEAVDIQTAIAAGSFRNVENLDSAFECCAFDALL